ncbi:MAG TPA: serine/threonine-protein kinase [Steroidobacter sp.]|nr:serine/threonine-protein kinase [Steroidobacter sp.]
MAVKLARFSWLSGGLAAALVAAVGSLLSSTTSAPFELAVYDRVLRSIDAAPSSQIVIAGVDQESVDRLGPWPWPREVHADALERLHAHGARVVALTIPLETARSTSDTEQLREALALLESSQLGDSAQARRLRSLLGDPRRNADARLQRTMREHGGVILPIELQIGETSVSRPQAPHSAFADARPAALLEAAPARLLREPNPELTEAAGALGHMSFPRDADGVVRSDLAAVRVGDALLPSMATAITARAAGRAPSDLVFDGGAHLVIGEHVAPLHQELRIRPHYFSADASAFTVIPYWRIALDEVSRQEIEDKIVIVGFSDPQLTPAAMATSPTGQNAAAAFAVASATSSMLTGHTYARPMLASALEWLAALGVIAFAAFALPAAGIAMGALATLLLAAALLLSEFGLLSSAQLWVRLTLPTMAAAAGYAVYALAELKRRSDAKSQAAGPGPNLRTLGLTFQRQGQLDLAFESFQRCPLDAESMDLLYQLGLDFERRRQFQKAEAAYRRIAMRDPNYRDLRSRRAHVRESALADTGQARRTPPTERTTPRVELEDFEPRTPTAAASRTLGRYEIERELGKGAMGVVYLGRDPHINRVVAIKAIPLAEEFEEDDLEEARARFFREAEMAGRLNHPGIVTVYDAGEDQGLAYIAMEYLQGRHLSHYADPARLLPPATVMLLVARVADALDYAHRQNVVHRDIKPANIMFNPDTDELKITDFGIARLTDVSRTKTGIVLGTPSFMSPEQLEGRPLDGRSDQFALAVSLYQLLCGQLPFRAESMPKLMQKIATEPHTPIHQVRPDLPVGVATIIDRALSKSADERFPDCKAMAAALRRLLGASASARATQPEHEWLLP